MTRKIPRLPFRCIDANGVSFMVADAEDAYVRFFDMIKRTKTLGSYAMKDADGDLIIALQIVMVL